MQVVNSEIRDRETHAQNKGFRHKLTRTQAHRYTFIHIHTFVFEPAYTHTTLQLLSRLFTSKTFIKLQYYHKQTVFFYWFSQISLLGRALNFNKSCLVIYSSLQLDFHWRNNCTLSYIWNSLSNIPTSKLILEYICTPGRNLKTSHIFHNPSKTPWTIRTLLDTHSRHPHVLQQYKHKHTQQWRTFTTDIHRGRCRQTDVSQERCSRHAGHDFAGKIKARKYSTEAHYRSREERGSGDNTTELTGYLECSMYLTTSRLWTMFPNMIIDFKQSARSLIIDTKPIYVSSAKCMLQW